MSTCAYEYMHMRVCETLCMILGSLDTPAVWSDGWHKSCLVILTSQKLGPNHKPFY